MRLKKKIFLYVLGIPISLFVVLLTAIYLRSNAVNRVNILDFYVIVLWYDMEDNSPWETPSKERRIDFEWDLKRNSMLSQDSILISITNTTGENLYYMTRGTPLSRLRTSMIITKELHKDTVNFVDFFCYTGVEPFPIKNNETISKWTFNPLYRYILEQSNPSWTEENFDQKLSELLGDKIEIQFKQAVYSPFWNHYKSQMVQSEFYSFESSEIINKIPFKRIKTHR